ncbi:TetR/AcrR family transcriptional regulator [Bacteroidota bacterium]
MVNLTPTEDKIFKAATAVFIEKGLDGARMQEIADKAGINKALLHYYFRSKEKLFKAIFLNIVEGLRPVLMEFFIEDDHLENKVSKFVSGYIDFISKNPHIPLFVLNELRKKPDFFLEILSSGKLINFGKIEKILDKEIKEGRINEIDYRHFIVNMMSLTIFPFIGKPIIQFFSQMEDEEFRVFIQERKKIVPEIIMNSIRP